ncbi:MAG TPA: hypothetical protein VMI54_08320 [Polyangiaceae bacterium]|nr:hypothetical protein [Polyangiaceae bacterium]
MVAVQDPIVSLDGSFELDCHEITVMDVAEGVPRRRLRIHPLGTTQGAPSSLKLLDGEKAVSARELGTVNPEIEGA